VLKGIADAGFEFCTPIQAKTLPISLNGKDVAGQAQTGTGKTAAFLVSLYAHLLRNNTEEKKGKGWVAPRALIIAPTRELARQILKDADVLGKYCDFKTLCIHGGIDYEKQKNEIKAGADILIVTPGRLIDFYKQKFFSLKSVEVLVIDEADRLFDMGFIQDTRYILRNIAPYNKRLSMLFSATLSLQVMELCYEHMNNAEKIQIEPGKVVVDEVEQSIYHADSTEKLNLLFGLLKKEGAEKTIIFCNTKRAAENVEAQLSHNGYKASQISGDVNQRVRIKVLEKFSKGEVQILIATDVASRGLHIDDISHVINYDIPQDPEDYIHRIGRTARAGAKGIAISLGCEDYIQHLERIEETLKDKIPIVWPDESLFVDYKKAPDRPDKRRSGPPPRRNGAPKNGSRPNRSRSSRPPIRNPRRGGTSKG
jgi:ATP-dependent RNA helicase RhlB